MAQFNPEYWEVATGVALIENTPAERGLWFETDIDRERRYALEEFFASVLPAVQEMLQDSLTPRQREVLSLYYFDNLTQEEIAERLRLSQSTVSRHLFGTTRNGRKVGGAIPKLRKAIDATREPRIVRALAQLKTRFDQAA